MPYGPFIDDVIGTGRPLLIGVHPRLSAAQKSFNNFLNSRARQRSIIDKGIANLEREASAQIAPEFPVDAVAHRPFLNSRARRRCFIDEIIVNLERDASAQIAPEFPIEPLADPPFLNSRGILAAAIAAVASSRS